MNTACKMFFMGGIQGWFGREEMINHALARFVSLMKTVRGKTSLTNGVDDHDDVVKSVIC